MRVLNPQIVALFQGNLMISRKIAQPQRVVANSGQLLSNVITAYDHEGLRSWFVCSRQAISLAIPPVR